MRPPLHALFEKSAPKTFRKSLREHNEKVFARLFQKAARIQRRGALVAARTRRNKTHSVGGELTCSPVAYSAFSFVSFSFAPRVSKEKRKTF